MTGENCDQQAIDLDWSMARENSCHLSVQNSEMGEIRDEMQVLSEDVSEKFLIIGNDINNIQLIQGVNLWIWGIIASTLIVMAVKKLVSISPKTKK